MDKPSLLHNKTNEDDKHEIAGTNNIILFNINTA
jgi:hypothetical protein